ncbi:MAG: GHKL domain-containing protein [Clostridium sp.]|nr:GHKL domain-containing protein [Acetatifactor muris]MCM1526916.1 GHKL domain-containing protein [Bacteroides sp.]MCM1563290.1 GHKL domain-containing protein [Clostridium sp.]
MTDFIIHDNKILVNFIVCVTTNLFRIWLISRFVHIFLEDDEKHNYGSHIKHMLAYGGFFVVNTVTYLAFHMMWINVTCNLLGIGLIVLTYTKSLKMILFVTGSVYMINMGCSTIAILPFVNYRDGVGFDQIYEVIDVFLVLVCELLTEKIVDTKRKTANVRNVSLCLVPLCSIGMLSMMIYTESSSETGLVIASIGLIMVNFFIFYLYNILSNTFFQQYENEVLRQEIQGYANQLDVMLQGEEKVRALRHDMKHHMNELKILAAKGETGVIEEYINDMQDFISNPNEIVSSGNLEIDSVMNYLLRRAKEELRTVNVNVRLPKSIGHSFDINVILGNLLENSIEAARQTDEKLLDVNIELRQGFLRIQIENSYDGKAVFNRESGYKKLLTTKKEKGLHGIGLENVRKMVEKHNGIMEVCPEADLFRVVLILYMSEVKN